MEGRAWCRPLVQDPSTARDGQEQPPSAAFLMRINQLNIDVWTWVTVLKILNRIIIQLLSYHLTNILNTWADSLLSLGLGEHDLLEQEDSLDE